MNLEEQIKAAQERLHRSIAQRTRRAKEALSRLARGQGSQKP